MKSTFPSGFLPSVIDLSMTVVPGLQKVPNLVFSTSEHILYEHIIYLDEPEGSRPEAEELGQMRQNEEIEMSQRSCDLSHLCILISA